MQSKKIIDKDRIDWIDIYKGIAIIMIALGHCSGVTSPFVYTFHVAAFFFISGYLEKLEEKSFFEIVSKKFTTLIIPYVGINLIFFVWRIILYITDIESHFYNDVFELKKWMIYLKQLFAINWTVDLGGATWFLIALFWGFVIAKIYIVITKNKNNIITLMLSVIGILVIVYLNKFDIYLRNLVDIAFIVAFYIILSNYIRKIELLEKIKIKKLFFVLIGIAVYVIAFVIIKKTTLDFPSKNYDNILGYIISSLCAVILLYNVSFHAEKSKSSKTLKYLGKNSLAFLGLHFFILRMIFVVEYSLGLANKELLKSLTPINSTWTGLLYTVLTVLIFVFINKKIENNNFYKIIFLGKLDTNKLLKWLNGKKLIRVVISLSICSILIISVPYKKIIELNYIGSDLEHAYNIKGYYEDNWSSPRMEIILKSGENGKMLMNFMVMEDTPKNVMKVYIDGKEKNKSELAIGENNISIDVPKSKKLKVKLEFSQKFIPSNVSDSMDNRELSVLISNIKMV